MLVCKACSAKGEVIIAGVLVRQVTRQIHALAMQALQCMLARCHKHLRITVLALASHLHPAKFVDKL
jgi:hypothetical protein